MKGFLFRRELYFLFLETKITQQNPGGHFFTVIKEFGVLFARSVGTGALGARAVLPFGWET